MGFSDIRNKVNENVGVVIGMVAVLVMAGMTIAASISANLKTAVVTASSFLELYFLIWIIKQF